MHLAKKPQLLRPVLLDLSETDCVTHCTSSGIICRATLHLLFSEIQATASLVNYIVHL